MTIDRASTNDLVMLAMDTRGHVPQNIGAVLVLGDGPVDVESTVQLIADRIGALPRLRQLLLRVPPGCGRPLWVDDPLFEARRHVRQQRCPAPGNEPALLRLAVAVCGEPLPRNRPLWAAVLVTGLTGERAALVLVLHHVMADGISGLAVLSSLLDQHSPSPALKPLQPRPSVRELIVDAARSRRRALCRLPAMLRGIPGSVTSAGGLHPPSAVSSSLQRRTGPRRQIAVARVDLAALRRAVHRYGATVNDGLLAAVAGALRRLLAARGEELDHFRVAVPVAPHRAAPAVDHGDDPAGHGEPGDDAPGNVALGNDNAPLVVEIPGAGDLGSRLHRISQNVRAARSTAADPSPAALLGPVFRALAPLGAYRFYANHQHRFHTLVSSLRGPEQTLSLAGSPIETIIPLAAGELGNVTVSFLALSYAGTMTVTAITDDRVTDLAVLAAALQSELSSFADLDCRPYCRA